MAGPIFSFHQLRVVGGIRRQHNHLTKSNVVEGVEGHGHAQSRGERLLRPCREERRVGLLRVRGREHRQVGHRDRHPRHAEEPQAQTPHLRLSKHEGEIQAPLLVAVVLDGHCWAIERSERRVRSDEGLESVRGLGNGTVSGVGL